MRQTVQQCYVVLGVWLAVACGLPGYLPAEIVTTVLATLVLVTGILHATWVEERRWVAHQAQAKDTGTGQAPVEEEDDGIDLVDESQAYMIPIVGSAVLGGLFLVYKFTALSFLVSIYLAVVSAFGIYNNMTEFAKLVNFGATWTRVVTSMWTRGAVAAAVAGAYWWTENFVLCNLLAINLCVLMLKTAQLSTVRTGIILLLGLFVYDCFWVFGSEPVFGSNVMVTVAKGIQAPIKLLIPRLMENGEVKLGLLGLGDIVVPGLFVKVILQFDWSEYNDLGKPRPKPVLFIVCVGAYAASLIVTHAVMMMFQAAQPALLYIVPGVIISVLVAAAVRGQLAALFAWSAAYEEEEEDGAGEGPTPAADAQAGTAADGAAPAGRDASGSSDVGAADVGAVGRTSPVRRAAARRAATAAAT